MAKFHSRSIQHYPYLRMFVVKGGLIVALVRLASSFGQNLPMRQPFKKCCAAMLQNGRSEETFSAQTTSLNLVYFTSENIPYPLFLARILHSLHK